MIQSLTKDTPTVVSGLTDGGCYSLLISTSGGGLVLVEAEVDDDEFLPLAKDNGLVTIPVLPGTKLRLTLTGAAAGKVKITPAA